jgi:hypothetical protein
MLYRSEFVLDDHCAYPLCRQLPAGFVRCAATQEGKVRTVVMAREASADLSIFRQTVS